MPRFELKPEQHQISRLFDYSQIEQFIVPVFQRPYSWKLPQCEQLWEDIKVAYTQMHSTQSNTNSRPNTGETDTAYFLGSIIVYPNSDNKKALNIIDGQQRITTIMLLLRAIYTTIENKSKLCEFSGEEEQSQYKGLLNRLGLMLWKPKDLLSLESAVDKDTPRLKRDNTDNNDINFANIMKYGKLDDSEDIITSSKMILEEYDKLSRNGNRGHSFNNLLASNECVNYAFFIQKCNTDLTELKGLFAFLYAYCYILLINTDSSESALDTFDILNNRGIQLADADIFKNKISQTYTENHINSFKEDWLLLTNALKYNDEGAPIANQTITLDGIFRHYMYAVRMSSKSEELIISKSKEPRLRDFYTRNPLGKKQLKDPAFLGSIRQMTKFLLLTLDFDLSDSDHSLFDNICIEDLVDTQVRYDINLLNKYQKLGKWQYLISTFWYCYKSIAHKQPKAFRSKFKRFIRYSTSVLFLKSILTGSSGDADIPFLCEKIALHAAAEGLIPPLESSFGISPQLDSKIIENRQILSGEIIRHRDEKTDVSRLDEAREILSGDTSKLNYLVLLYTYSFDETAALQDNHQALLIGNPEKQPILLNSTIEHILPQKWQTYYGPYWLHDCSDDEALVNEYVEHLGNKIILPRDRNIRASDRPFASKLHLYGETNRATSSITFELMQFIAEHQNTAEWTRCDVDKRTHKMIDAIINYIQSGIEGGIA
ncbi:MAG: DUF262 domain-containing protein [Proteobacteria bacterium]|nr:DUF262 domain-containing protein [Pseudomonadota bacterium]